MMKKLAVTAFALSLTALGCGSDSGGKNDAAPKKDVQPGAEVQVSPDAAWGPEAQGPGLEVGQPDTKPPVDLATDQPLPIDQAIDHVTPIDVPQTLDGGVDAPAIDATVDVKAGESGAALDGGVDRGSVG